MEQSPVDPQKYSVHLRQMIPVRVGALGACAWRWKTGPTIDRHGSTPYRIGPFRKWPKATALNDDSPESRCNLVSVVANS